MSSLLHHLSMNVQEHKKIIEKGVPDDAIPGIKRSHVSYCHCWCDRTGIFECVYGSSVHASHIKHVNSPTHHPPTHPHTHTHTHTHTHPHTLTHTHPHTHTHTRECEAAQMHKD